MLRDCLEKLAQLAHLRLVCCVQVLALRRQGARLHWDAVQASIRTNGGNKVDVLHARGVLGRQEHMPLVPAC